MPADQAYGERREDMVITVDREHLPDDLEPEIGVELQLSQQDGQVIMVRVTGVTDSDITIDANHPLAGEDLTFDIELMDVV